jgi:hypothetical protein
MPLPSESAQPGEKSRTALAVFTIWNRKFHYYLGLYFLFFLWLFAFTGLLLNHSWQFAEFWPNRNVSTFERTIDAPRTGSDVDRAKEVMRQLGIRGEIEWTATRPNSTLFEFRVNRPGHSFNIAVADPGRAKVEETQINTWGIMRVLHTFTGVRANETRNQRDWRLTTLWVLSMDAVSLGMVVMVLGGIYMWLGLRTKRKVGFAALLTGTAVCCVFVFALRWI